MRPRGRSTPGTAGAPGFVPTLHGIRGAAVLTIVLYHVAGGAQWEPNGSIWRPLYESGFLAVDVLFFTTGFVLSLPILLNGTIGSLRGFAIRRWGRLAPAFYVSLVVVGLMLPLLSTPAIRQYVHLGPQYFAIHFAFLHWELISADTGFIVDRPVWTLSIDVCFYLLLPLIAAGYLRRPLLGLIAALGVSQLWRALFIQVATPPAAQDKLIWLVQFPLFLGDFASGMTAAWLFVGLRRRPRTTSPRTFTALALGALAGLLVLSYLAGSNLPYQLGAYQEPAVIAALFPLCLIVFVLAVSRMPSRAQWPLTNRATQWFTEISYSVYLYHYPIILFALFTLGVKADHHFPLLMMLAALPATVIIGTISCYLIERPGRRYTRALSARLGARSGARPSPRAGR